MSRISPVSQRSINGIRNVRAKRRQLFRQDAAGKLKAMDNVAVEVWPLVSAAAVAGRLPSRTTFKTMAERKRLQHDDALKEDISKLILFKLSHPDFDWEALNADIARQEAGISLTEDEMDTRIAQAQAQADRISLHFGHRVGFGSPGLRDAFEADLAEMTMSDSRRYNGWSDYIQSDYMPAKQRLESTLAKGHQRWGREKVFHVCEALHRLVMTLNNGSVSARELSLLACQYKADVLLRRAEWKGRPRAAVLACAILAAPPSASGTGFQADPPLASKIYTTYAAYVSAKRKAKRHPSRRLHKLLSLQFFQQHPSLRLVA